MALTPLLDHGVTVGEGSGALLALPLVQAAAALAAELPERAPEPESEPERSELPSESAPEEKEAETEEPSKAADTTA